MKCETCANLRKPTDEKAARWLLNRGLALCSELKKQLGRPVVVTLNHVGKPLCEAKHWRERETTD